jgi:hypothetical protein
MVDSLICSSKEWSLKNNETRHEQFLIQRLSIPFQLQQHKRFIWFLNYNQKSNSLRHIKIYLDGYSTTELESFWIRRKIKRVLTIRKNMENVVKRSVNSIWWWNRKSSNLWRASIRSYSVQIKIWVYRYLFQKFKRTVTDSNL